MLATVLFGLVGSIIVKPHPKYVNELNAVLVSGNPEKINEAK